MTTAERLSRPQQITVGIVRPFTTLISVEEALNSLLNLIVPIQETKTLSIEHAVGRVVA
jgi:hypothetical protein